MLVKRPRPPLLEQHCIAIASPKAPICGQRSTPNPSTARVGIERFGSDMLSTRGVTWPGCASKATTKQVPMKEGNHPKLVPCWCFTNGHSSLGNLNLGYALCSCPQRADEVRILKLFLCALHVKCKSFLKDDCI